MDVSRFDLLHRLAATAYEPGVLLPRATLEAWHRVNPDIYWLAWHHGQLAGYLSALPLAPDVFRHTMLASFDEKRLLGPHAIRAYEEAGEYQVFFSSIVVREGYRGRSDASRRLRIGFLEDLASLADRGIEITALSSEVVSKEGMGTMESLGMRYLRNSTRGTRLFYTRTSPAALRRRAARLRDRHSGAPP